MKRVIIVGEYNRRGYTIRNANTGKVLHTAGNSQQDSTVTVDPDTLCALSLQTIWSYCVQTAREIAAKCGGVYGGVERSKDDE